MPHEKRLPTARIVLLDSLILFLLAGGLVYKLFAIEYTRNWGSIESTFIADSRMLAESLPHPPHWQPLWYCGTRFDYIYPPALRYAPALLSKLTGVSTARAYHLYTAVLYAFGIVAAYWLVLAGSRSRWMACVCAIATALLSPSFLLLPRFRMDSGFWVPQRLHVLLAYGEGPHISALCILGAALAASSQAFRTRRLSWVALAGLACALVVSHNFYGATALAIFFPLLLWAEWLGSHDNKLLLKAAGIVALAWGFCAFWLAPSYLAITIANLQWVDGSGNKLSQLVAILALILLFDLTWRYGNRRPQRTWAVFVFSSAAVLFLYVACFDYFGFQLTGSPARLVPELDLSLILALAQLCFWCWQYKKLRFLPVLIGILALVPAITYLSHLTSPFSRQRNIENQYEYQLTQWVHRNLPGQRVLPSGSLRFWYDAWFDNAQPDGGSNQGLENQNLMQATWQITAGHSGPLAMLWLQVLGVGAVIVPDSTSLDQYHDYASPQKFQGVLTPLFDNGHGTRIYLVPRKYNSLARVVDTSKQAALTPIHGGDDWVGLRKYLDVVEAGPDSPATLVWHGFDAYDIQATTSPGQALLVQETYDPAWRAQQGGRVLQTHPDVMGFTIVDVPPGPHTIQMRFQTPLENQIGYGALVLSCGAFFFLCLKKHDETRQS